MRGSTIYKVDRPSAALTSTATRSPAELTDTTWAPEGRAIRSEKVAPDGAAPVEGLDMRREISDATTMKPTTISRPITTTSTFSQSGAEEACGEEGGAKKTS